MHKQPGKGYATEKISDIDSLMHVHVHHQMSRIAIPSKELK